MYIYILFDDTCITVGVCFDTVRRSTTNMAAARQRSRVQQSPPKVDKQMTDVAAMDGASATFECQISGMLSHCSPVLFSASHTMFYKVTDT